MSDKYTFVGMRECSSDDEDISDIEKSRLLRVLLVDIVVYDDTHDHESSYLERESSDRE
jgi:hypothetical protein